jgi:hypothetical protein
MQVTLFKGLLPVNFPDDWFSPDPQKITFSQTSVDGYPAQGIDFTANGGKAYLLWIEPNGTDVRQCYKELDGFEIEKLEWGDTPHYIEPRSVVKLFGQSSKVLKLS